MIEAGSIDGAGFFGIYRWIVFPLSLPGFVVVIIWQFTQIWNEFLFAVTLTDQKSQPITVALAYLAGGEAVNWNLPMAGAMIAAMPTLLVYILLGTLLHPRADGRLRQGLKQPGAQARISRRSRISGLRRFSLREAVVPRG